MLAHTRLVARQQTRPISHLAGDREQFDAPPSMELIKRGRAICSYTPGRTTGIPEARWRRQYRKVGSRQPRNQRGGESPVATTTTDYYGLGRNLHDLISLRLTPRAIPVTLSLSMLAMRGSNHSRDDPFYSVHPSLFPARSFMLRKRHLLRAAARIAPATAPLPSPFRGTLGPPHH